MARADIRLSSIDKLIKDGQPQFGIFAQVNTINYLDYHSHLLSQKPVATWRKRIKANQFAFIQLIHPPYRVCIAVATIKLASSAFVYSYNDDSGHLEVVEAIRPLSYGSKFTGDHQHGTIRFSHPMLTLKLTFTPLSVGLTLNSDIVRIEATLSRGKAPLAVCTPSGRRGWTFTQKEPLQVIGTLHLKQTANNANGFNQQTQQRIMFNPNTLANLDWTLGFMRHITNWFWACINTTLADNRHFMLNLSMGVNETGVSENACWLEGQIFYLPPVFFCRDESRKPKHLSNERDNKLWTIQHQNLGWSTVTIDLTFKPIKVYKKTDNFGVIASIFEQWIGEYSGVIDMGDAMIRLDKVLGLAEDHFAKW